MNEILMDLGPVFTISALVVLFINIAFGYAVWKDAESRKDRSQRVYLTDPVIWGLAIIAWSILGVALYWLMHYSSLSKPPGETEDMHST